VYFTKENWELTVSETGMIGSRPRIAAVLLLRTASLRVLTMSSRATRIPSTLSSDAFCEEKEFRFVNLL
jgi:hypothetical protein